MADDTTRIDRVWTVPNLLSMARLAGVPVFLWLVLGPEEDGWALLLLMVSGITDYLDGWLARKLDQTSRLGQVLDPVADRLYILAVVVGPRVPRRDPVVGGPDPAAARRRCCGSWCRSCAPAATARCPVHFLGKAATFNLLYAFPLLLLGDGEGTVATLADVFGWAFAGWGIGLYWWAGVLYAYQVYRFVQTTPRRAAAPDG